MLLKDTLPNAIFENLKAGFPDKGLCLETNSTSNLKCSAVKSICENLFADGQSCSSVITRGGIRRVGIITTYNNECENAYIVFLDSKCGFVPFKIEIAHQFQQPDLYILKTNKSENHKLSKYNTPATQQFDSEKNLIDYIAPAFAMWLDLRGEI